MDVTQKDSTAKMRSEDSNEENLIHSSFRRLVHLHWRVRTEFLGWRIKMTSGQEKVIQRLRLAGESYTSIAGKTGMAVGTIKAYCSRQGIKPSQNEAQHCARCGKALVTVMYLCRPQRFCSTQCRTGWWQENRDKRVRNGAVHVCSHCRKEYTSYNKQSKYCSHSCYIAQRFRTGEQRP